MNTTEHTNTPIKVLVIGANGATGRAVVQELCARGHAVTAFVRQPRAMGAETSQSLRIVTGDVMNADDVERAVVGQDAVVVVLGIRESALMVRLRGSSGTAMNVRSVGTQNVVRAMHHHGVQRLVVQTTYGIGDTRERLSWMWKAIFRVLLHPQIEDSERQEQVVCDSGLQWVLVRPVGLNDGPCQPTLVSASGETRSMAVSRLAVADVLADATQRSEYLQQRLAVSA